jgi:hypothetical protein
MKKNFFALLFLFVLPLSLCAQLVSTQIPKQFNKIDMGTVTNKILPLTEKSKLPSPLAYKILDTLNDASFSNYCYTTPFIYEPISKTLVLVGCRRAQSASDQNNMDGLLYVKTSQDGGSSWAKRKDLYLQTGTIPLYPSVSVLNPDKSSDVSQFNYLLYSPIATKNAQNQWPWAGAVYVIVNKGNIESLPQVGPVNNKQSWFWTKTASYQSDAEGFCYNAGTLIQGTGQQYGAYGVSSFYFSSDAYDFWSMSQPKEWGFDRFKPAPALTSTYNGWISIDADYEGGVYAAVNNIFVDDTNHRVPGFSKSLDYGQTWSEFTAMPWSTIEGYINTTTGDPTMSFFYAYTADGFVVTGKDKFSFVTRLALVNIDNGQRVLVGLEIVEITYNSGVWGMRKVADYHGTPYVLTESSQSTTTQLVELYDEDRLGNEIQIVKTADGNDLLVKWLDYNMDLGLQALPTPIPINVNVFNQNTGEWEEQSMQLDSLYTTDVYTTYRSKTGDTWSQPLNVTNDLVYNKVSWVPNIIPSLSNVPLLTDQTGRIRYNDANNPRNSYPDFLQQLVVDYPQFVTLTNFDATGSSTAVENQPTANPVALNNIYPNPVNEYAEISFNLDKPAVTRIELHDALGQLVQVLQEGSVSSGINAINFNAKNLASGIYYCTLTVNGKAYTKMMTVVK